MSDQGYTKLIEEGGRKGKVAMNDKRLLHKVMRYYYGDMPKQYLSLPWQAKVCQCPKCKGGGHD